MNKKASIEQTFYLLDSKYNKLNNLNNLYYKYFSDSKKKDDLADSFLQILAYLKVE